MELGLITFADMQPERLPERGINAQQRIKDFDGSIYLVVFGQNIPLLVYLILAVTNIISGYFTYKKIHKRINTA